MNPFNYHRWTNGGRQNRSYLDLAEQLHAEVISGDAYQVYKQLNIGTAKPSADELKRVKTSSYRYIRTK